MYCHNFFASQLHLLRRDGVTKSRPHWLRMATAVQERKAEKAGFTRLSCNCLELDWQKNTDTLCKRWLFMNFDFAIFVDASVRELFQFTLSQMLGMLVLVLFLSLSRLASLPHSRSIGNRFLLSLRNGGLCRCSYWSNQIAVKYLWS